MIELNGVSYYSPAFHEKRAKVVAELKKLQMETEPIIKIFEDEEVSKMIQTTRDGRQLFEYLTKNHGVSISSVIKV